VVVVRDEHRVEPLDVAVDEHERDALRAQPLVAFQLLVGVGVHPGDDDQPRELVLEEHLDPSVLHDAVVGLRADDRHVAALRRRQDKRRAACRERVGDGVENDELDTRCFCPRPGIA
jgi:hypothetical protein